MPRLLTGFILLAAISQANAGDIYKCKAEDGSMTFSDKPCAGVVISAPAVKQHQDLSQDSLQGQWLITHLGNTPSEELDVGTDIWEFKGNQYTVISNDHRMRPDPFTVSGDVIDLGYAKIKVKEFSGGKMVVDTLGIEQTLKRM